MISRSRFNFATSILRSATLENGAILRIKHGDITQEQVDVIVNNANSLLIHDEGLALSLIQNGGSQIQDESRKIIEKFGQAIPTGNVVATSGGALPCKKVIHAVAPIYSKRGYENPLMLKKTIGNSLRLTALMKMETIAMLILCTGLYKWPSSIVSRLLLDEILHFTHHDFKKQLTEINLVDISEARSKILCKEFDQRDFQQGGQRKDILKEWDNLLSDRVEVLVTKSGTGRKIPNSASVFLY